MFFTQGYFEGRLMIPAAFNGWEITRILHWFHCRKEGWESAWFHVSEIPSAPLAKWLKVRLP